MGELIPFPGFEPARVDTWLIDLADGTRWEPFDLVDAGIHLADCPPVRARHNFPGMLSKPGWYWSDVEPDDLVIFESLAERDALTVLHFEYDLAAVAWTPCRVWHQDTGKPEYHELDFVALCTNGDTVVADVRPADRVNDKFRRKSAWTKDMCDALDWTYRHFDDNQSQYVANVKKLSLHARPLEPQLADWYVAPVLDLCTADSPAIDDVLIAVAKGVTDGDVLLVWHVIQHLLWTRRLATDLHGKVGGDSQLMLGPAALGGR